MHFRAFEFWQDKRKSLISLSGRPKPQLNALYKQYKGWLKFITELCLFSIFILFNVTCIWRGPEDCGHKVAFLQTVCAPQGWTLITANFFLNRLIYMCIYIVFTRKQNKWDYVKLSAFHSAFTYKNTCQALLPSWGLSVSQRENSLFWAINRLIVRWRIRGNPCKPKHTF